jgi:hypothetical protein
LLVFSAARLHSLTKTCRPPPASSLHDYHVVLGFLKDKLASHTHQGILPAAVAPLHLCQTPLLLRPPVQGDGSDGVRRLRFPEDCDQVERRNAQLAFYIRAGLLPGTYLQDVEEVGK